MVGRVGAGRQEVSEQGRIGAGSRVWAGLTGMVGVGSGGTGSQDGAGLERIVGVVRCGLQCQLSIPCSVCDSNA
jgi:hypothetical protein